MAARFGLTLASLLFALPAPASETCTRDAMIVFDGSGSMSEMGFNNLDEPRIFEARKAVRRAMPPIAKRRRLGLIVYGPSDGDACSSVDLRFPPVRDAAPAIIDAVETLEPTGETPLTAAVQAAADVLGYRENPGIVVLVTDGKETCGGEPCALAAELAKGADLTVHVIGFRVRGEHFNWDKKGRNDYTDATSVARCLADQTGGKYVPAETVDDLVAALHQTLGCQTISERAVPKRRHTT